MKNILLVGMLIITLFCSGYSQDTITVYAGWNNIGSLQNGGVPDILVSVPPGIIESALWKYSPGIGYQSSDNLEKGLGYWVKVSSDGLIIFNSMVTPDSCGIKIVDYLGAVYHTVRIGNQCWLKENLNLGTMIQGTDTASNNGTVEKYCYDDDTSNCTTYGGLYFWNEAMEYSQAQGARGICPPGWHIPTHEEFQTLTSVDSGNGNALKAVGQGTGDGAGTNTSGFTALLAGKLDGTFTLLGDLAFFWSSQEFAGAVGYFGLSGYERNSFYNYAPKYTGFCVRCVED